MKRATRIFKAADWKSFYYVTMGALIGSSFNLQTTVYVGIGAGLAFLMFSFFENIKD